MRGRSISPNRGQFGAKLAEMSAKARYRTPGFVGDGVWSDTVYGSAVGSQAGASGSVVFTTDAENQGTAMAMTNTIFVNAAVKAGAAASAVVLTDWENQDPPQAAALNYAGLDSVPNSVLTPFDNDTVFTVRYNGSPGAKKHAAAFGRIADQSWFVDSGSNMTLVADGGAGWVPSNPMRVYEYFKTSIRDFRHAATSWLFNRRTNEPPPPGYQPGNFGLWLPFDCDVPHPMDVDLEFVCEPSPKAEAMGVKAVSFVIKSEWLAPGPPTSSSRRGLRKVLARAMGLAFRALFKRLRRFVTHLVRLEGLHRLREFVGKQRPWHLHHGAHPPRFSALEHFAVRRPINFPGAPA
jgi:hypothetical protein